jgi:hypothetical protein
MPTKQEILDLASKVPVLYPNSMRTIVTDEDINEYERKHDIYIPKEFREWLLIGNGILVEPGAVFGINLPDNTFELSRRLNRYLFWRFRGWLPISTDGCGSYYVMDTKTKIKTTHPIYFIDLCDFEKPDYVVASGLWKFLYFLFSRQIIACSYEELKKYWPFNKECVIAEDPDILLCTTAPLPWEADAGNDDDGGNDNGGFTDPSPRPPIPTVSITF